MSSRTGFRGQGEGAEFMRLRVGGGGQGHWHSLLALSHLLCSMLSSLASCLSLL